jgi:hypothetical protein
MNMNLKPIKPAPCKGMPISRFGFGACPSVDNQRLYMIGGYIDRTDMLKYCDYIKIDDDFGKHTSNGTIINPKWVSMPELNVARASSSVCEFASDENNKWLFCLGGLFKDPIDNVIRLSSTIERIQVMGGKNPQWETLTSKLPKPLCDAAAFQINDTQICVAGGVYINANEFQPKDEQKTGSKDQESSKSDSSTSPGAKSSEAYIFDVVDNQLVLAKTLKLDFQDSFTGDVVQNIEDLTQSSKITLVGDSRIHYFDLDKQEFSSFRFTPIQKIN